MNGVVEMTWLLAGKTRLIRETLAPVVAAVGGYLLVGKYDPLRLLPEPYAGLVAALTQFVTQVCCGVRNQEDDNNADRVQAVRRALAETQGVGEQDWQVLVGMIPALQQIFRNDETTTTTTDTSGSDGRREARETADAETAAALSSSYHPHQQQKPPLESNGASLKRFSYVFLMFLRAMSSLSTAVVLLLDDAHWADPSSLQILSNIVADLPHCPSLFVVVTYDDNNHGENDGVVARTALETICEERAPRSKVVVTRVSIGNLNRDDVARFMSQALDMNTGSPSPRTVELASLVFDQTNGNFLYLKEFVKHLLKRDLLLYPTNSDCGFGWRFDVPTIQASMAKCRGISDLLMLRLEILSSKLQQFLKVASCCCGSQVPVDVLQYVYGDMTAPLLQQAAALELLTKNDQVVADIYSFAHDIIHQVVYDMIPDQEREQFHLEIGRRIWNATDAVGLERSVFVLISQFYLAKRLLLTELSKERCDLARLCLLAGRKAAKYSTFRTACIYLNLGIEFLGANGWTDDYHLTLALYNSAAEMHLCVVDFDAMELLINVVVKEARHMDGIQSETTRLYAWGMRNKPTEAIELGIQLLARLGERFPRRLGMARLLLEFARVHRQCIGKSDEDLLCLPAMMDAEKLACIQILNLLFLPAMLVRPKLTPFVVLKFTSLTINYGQCLLSPQAFAVYGMLLVALV
jgi:predicted ATPase